MAFDHFVELDRRFGVISELTDSEEAAFLSYSGLFTLRESELGWNDLLASRIVVVLGEPGSGKTWELRHREMNRGTSVPRVHKSVLFYCLRRLRLLDRLLRGKSTVRTNVPNVIPNVTTSSGPGRPGKSPFALCLG
jgi:hypothetical protein